MAIPLVNNKELKKIKTEETIRPNNRPEEVKKSAETPQIKLMEKTEEELPLIKEEELLPACARMKLGITNNCVICQATNKELFLVCKIKFK